MRRILNRQCLQQENKRGLPIASGTTRLEASGEPLGDLALVTVSLSRRIGAWRRESCNSAAAGSTGAQAQAVGVIAEPQTDKKSQRTVSASNTFRYFQISLRRVSPVPGHNQELCWAELSHLLRRRPLGHVAMWSASGRNRYLIFVHNFLLIDWILSIEPRSQPII